VPPLLASTYLILVISFAPTWPSLPCLLAFAYLLLIHLVHVLFHHHCHVCLCACLYLFVAYLPCFHLFCHCCCVCLLATCSLCSCLFRHHYLARLLVTCLPCLHLLHHCHIVCVLMCVCCFSTLFVPIQPSLHCVCASNCLLPIHLVHVCFAIIALRVCFLFICLVRVGFAIITHMFTTCLPCSHLFRHHHVVCLFRLLVTYFPCSCLLHHHCLLVYYLSTFFTPILPSSIFGHHVLSTKLLFCHCYLMCLLSHVYYSNTNLFGLLSFPYLLFICLTTIALGSRSSQGLPKVRVEKET
jgi:hypothetical protein